MLSKFLVATIAATGVNAARPWVNEPDTGLEEFLGADFPTGQLPDLDDIVGLPDFDCTFNLSGITFDSQTTLSVFFQNAQKIISVTCTNGYKSLHATTCPPRTFVIPPDIFKINMSIKKPGDVLTLY